MDAIAAAVEALYRTGVHPAIQRQRYCRRNRGRFGRALWLTAALQEFIAGREQRRLLELFGKLEWHPAYDYKRERSRD